MVTDSKLYQMIIKLGGLLMRGRGLEPPCLAALAPKASASANFATRALSYCSHKLQKHKFFTQKTFIYQRFFIRSQT